MEILPAPELQIIVMTIQCCLLLEFSRKRIMCVDHVLCACDGGTCFPIREGSMYLAPSMESGADVPNFQTRAPGVDPINRLQTTWRQSPQAFCSSLARRGGTARKRRVSVDLPTRRAQSEGSRSGFAVLGERGDFQWIHRRHCSLQCSSFHRGKGRQCGGFRCN